MRRGLTPTAAEAKKWATLLVGGFSATLIGTYPASRIYLRGNASVYEYSSGDTVFQDRGFWKTTPEACELVHLLTSLYSAPKYSTYKGLYMTRGIMWMDKEVSRLKDFPESVDEETIRSEMIQAERDRLENMWPWWRALARAGIV